MYLYYGPNILFIVVCCRTYCIFGLRFKPWFSISQHLIKEHVKENNILTTT